MGIKEVENWGHYLDVGVGIGGVRLLVDRKRLASNWGVDSIWDGANERKKEETDG